MRGTNGIACAKCCTDSVHALRQASGPTTTLQHLTVLARFKRTSSKDVEALSDSAHTEIYPSHTSTPIDWSY